MEMRIFMFVPLRKFVLYMNFNSQFYYNKSLKNMHRICIKNNFQFIRRKVKIVMNLHLGKIFCTYEIKFCTNFLGDRKFDIRYGMRSHILHNCTKVINVHLM